MKKILFPSAIIFFAAILFSCKKDHVQNPAGSGSPEIASIPAQTKIISNWLSVPLQLASSRNRDILFGQFVHNTGIEYDYDKHVQLVFVKLPGRNETYLRLSGQVSSPAGVVQMSYSLDYNLLSITVSSRDLLPEPAFFDDFQYRFVVVGKSLYSSLSIDWSDYDAVAAVLNL